MAKTFKDLANACWDGYKAVGLKDKNGKKVPNCVKESSEEEHEIGIDHRDSDDKTARKHIESVIKKHGLKATGASDKETYFKVHKDKVEAVKRDLKAGRVHPTHWVNGDWKEETILEADEIQSADYKLSKSGKKIRAKHIIFHNQDDDKDDKEKQMKEENLQESSYKGDGKVETKKYSWGTMKTVHHGADFSIPLHPEHHQEIAKLKDQQEHKFKDETGRHWTAKRVGDKVHFQGANGGNSTQVKHADLKEELKPSMGAGKYIDDFQKSDAPQFKGKSKEKRRVMALAAYLSAKKDMKEEVEQLDEISKKTTGEYIKSASNDKMSAANELGVKGAKLTIPDAQKLLGKINKRNAGISKAVDRLTKEETEQLDEISKKTLSSYVKKAASDLANKGASIAKKQSDADEVDRYTNRHMPNQSDERERMKKAVGADHETINKTRYGAIKRNKGISKAVDRLAKEEYEMISEEDIYGAAQKHLDLANAAKSKGNKAAYHLHMADHHDYMTQWHDSKGRSREAEKHADKAAGHEQAAHDMKEEVELQEAADKMQQLRDAHARHEKKAIEANRAGDDEKTKLHQTYMNKIKDKMAKLVRNEEVEQLEEANHREFAAQGKMHPDMAKHMETGREMDFYAHGTGDKMSGKVIKNDGKEVHVKVTHNPYKEKDSSVHKFKVTNKLDEEVRKSDIPAYLRKKKGETPLTVADVKAPRKDSISAAQNLAKQRNEDFENGEVEKSMKSYKDFVQSLNEYNSTDGTYRHKGNYGGSHQETDEDDEDKPKSKPASTEKRGRGRPKGSSSGARQQGSASANKSNGADYTGYKLHLPNSK